MYASSPSPLRFGYPVTAYHAGLSLHSQTTTPPATTTPLKSTQPSSPLKLP
ncbi:hypothetical protein PGT21_034836 [Puccinia graminis f. sp. tritici]|uniref:Uncharacterized protein n=1 Tax=Puccinia graminis f. sp. tritici TaxID=56615 RepID=A0A5B0MHA8_PUCGR|nr:hypothetical protein PGT21_034836 [Puccinia graminis f. sp. tritici]